MRRIFVVDGSATGKIAELPQEHKLIVCVF